MCVHMYFLLRGEPKARSAVKQTSKKRSGLSLRAKLYNKYRPPPKTILPCGSVAAKNIPTTTFGINSKNSLPSQSINKRKISEGEGSGSCSDSSIENYLVKFEELDVQSSFFNVVEKPSSSVPNFDCNNGIEDLPKSSIDGTKDKPKMEEKTFDFNSLLEYAKSMEYYKESVAKHSAEEANKKSSSKKNIDALDVYSVLALGEKKYNGFHNCEEDEDDEDDEELCNETGAGKNELSKLSKTKSTRIKRHTKTRTSSAVDDNHTDDSDWEEVTGRKRK